MILTNKYNLDSIVKKAVQNDYQCDPNRYSVTSLSKSFKELLLSRRYNDKIIKDISSMGHTIFGQSVHSYMESVSDDFVQVSEEVYKMFKDVVDEAKEEFEALEGQEDVLVSYHIKPRLKEKHLVMGLKSTKYRLSGYCDLYNLLANEVSDYKTASVNKVLFNDWTDYRKQLLDYAVLLNQNGLPCNRGKLIVFLKDWVASKRYSSPDYPKCPIFEISWEFSYEELEQERQWIEDFFIQLEKAEQLEDDDIAPCEELKRSFNRKPDFAVIPKGRKRAVRKFEGENAYDMAVDYVATNTKYNVAMIVKRPATEIKCLEYCDSCHWCNHFIKNHAKIVLVDKDGKTICGFKTYEEALEYQKTIPEYKDLIIKPIDRESDEEEIENA